MRFGFYLPTRGPTATREGVLALAREGERLGLHSAMIADHIVFPTESESVYPYTVDHKHPGGGDALETFSILGVVAGATERLRLVTSVLVLPYRNPVLTAKMVASLDVLSGGRVTLGVGVGSHPVGAIAASPLPAAGNTEPSEHAATPDGSRGARLFGAHAPRFFSSCGSTLFGLNTRCASNGIRVTLPSRDNRSTAHLAPRDIFQSDFDRQLYRITLVGEPLVGADGNLSRSIEGMPIRSAAEELRIMAAE